MDRSFSFCAVPAAEGGWPLEILQNVEIQMDRRKRQGGTGMGSSENKQAAATFPFRYAQIWLWKIKKVLKVMGVRSQGLY